MTRTTLGTTLLSACLTAVVSSAPSPQGQAPDVRQTPPVTFRATSNFVEIDAIVTTADGAFVRGLGRDDFELAEDGKTQNISICSLVDIPIERPDPPLFRATPIEPDVVSNEQPFGGRVFVIVLDAFHVAPTRASIVQQQARRFVERYLGVNDLAAVVHIGSPIAGQEFTSNKRLLAASIQRFSSQGLHSATYNIVRDAMVKNDQKTPEFNPGPPADPDARERAYLATESVDAVHRVADAMAGLTGRRKAVLFFSEGIDYETTEAPVAPFTEETGQISGAAGKGLAVRDSSTVRASQESMIAAATRANVSVYSIDPKGLTAGMDDAISVGILPSVGSDAQYSYLNDTLQSDLSRELRISQESLRLFADQTGGLAIVGQNDMDDAFRRILEDNSSYYVLGYAAPDGRRDGRFHRLSIRVKRPGLRVRARNGYHAPDKASTPITADPLGTAMRSPTPQSGLGMRVSASVFRTAELKGRVHVTVEFNGRDLTFARAGGVFAEDIDLGYVAQHMNGTTQASNRYSITLRLQPATYQAVGRDGVRYITEFEVPPGLYQLRLAAYAHGSGRTGSVLRDLDVPDFAKIPLAVSDLLITSSAADQTRTGFGSRTVSGAKLPGQSTTARTFSSADTISVFAAIYDNDRRTTHSVDIKTSIRSDSGSQVFSREDARSSQEFAATAGEFPYLIRVPLTGLAPGRYVLTIQARSRLADESVQKDVEFTVVARTGTGTTGSTGTTGPR